jgi:hypothetical protein
MAFTYSGFQLVAEGHYLVTGRRLIGGPWGNYFNLAMDQARMNKLHFLNMLG